MSQKDIEEKEIISHFEKLIDELKMNTLCAEKKRDLSILYIKHIYLSNVNNLSENDNDNDNDKNLEYLSLGWYIHHFLIKNN